MKITRSRPARVILCAVVATGATMAATPSSAVAAGPISQATAQAVNLNLLQGALTVAVSNPPTSATNDGNTSDDAEVHAQPLISALTGQKVLEVGALSETAEAKHDGSSYGCAGIVSPDGQIQIGDHGKSCYVTPSGAHNGKGGITLDLGALCAAVAPNATPLAGLLGKLTGALAGITDIKITADAITAHGYQNGTDPAILGATLVNVRVHLGTLLDLPIKINPDPNSDLLGTVLGAVSPQLGLLGSQVSDLIKGIISLTTNYQPEATMAAHGIKAAVAPQGGQDPSVSGLHITVLNGGVASADLAKVTVGPNAPSAGTDAFSFAKAPIILGGLGLLVALAYGVRFGVRRVRAFV